MSAMYMSGPAAEATHDFLWRCLLDLTPIQTEVAPAAFFVNDLSYHADADDAVRLYVMLVSVGPASNHLQPERFDIPDGWEIEVETTHGWPR